MAARGHLKVLHDDVTIESGREEEEVKLGADTGNCGKQLNQKLSP